MLSSFIIQAFHVEVVDRSRLIFTMLIFHGIYHDVGFVCMQLGTSINIGGSTKNYQRRHCHLCSVSPRERSYLDDPSLSISSSYHYHRCD